MTYLFITCIKEWLFPFFDMCPYCTTLSRKKGSIFFIFYTYFLLLNSKQKRTVPHCLCIENDNLEKIVKKILKKIFEKVVLGFMLKKILDLFAWKPEREYHFSLPEKDARPVQVEDNSQNPNMSKTIFPSLQVNLDFVKAKYNTLINSDIIIREFTLYARNKQYKAFLLFIDGMVDSKLINDFILNPLMLRNVSNTYQGDPDRIISEAVTNNITVRKVKRFDIVEYISSCLLPQNNVETFAEFSSIFSGVNSGNCALFIDTLSLAFDIEVKGFKQRSVDTPQNETVIKGPHEAFTENIRTNTSLLRRIINNENLIVESVEVGKITKTKCAVCYMQDIANDDLINEVKYRLHNLAIDSLLSAGQLEQLICDEDTLGISQVLLTERPDKTTHYLLQGRVAVIVNGTPYSIIMPSTLKDFMSSPEDNNLKPYFANFLKTLRFLAAFLTLLLPGIYIAITSFHQEILPTELLFSILASRQNVPFPVIVEILVMEVSFELIREAGLRVPSPIGPTIGIVGALVLGQAAVSANIVSPILIIIVAITGIASFAIPDFAFGFHLRLFRFVFILLGYIAGFLGISLGLFVYISMLSNLTSFGVPFTLPIDPIAHSRGNSYFIPPIWKQEYRASFLDPKKEKTQDKISMKWKKGGF